MEGAGGARSPVIGLILAGGDNSRMGGRFKGDLELGGERYVVRVARALRSLPVERLLVSLREGQKMILDDMGGHIPLSFVRDPREGLGPLGGLLAALGCLRAAPAPSIRLPGQNESGTPAACRGRLLAVCPCDTPLVTATLYRRLIDSLRVGDAGAMPAVDGRPHPLNAVYRLTPDLERRVHAAVREGTLGVLRALEGLPIRFLDLSDDGDARRALTNVNAPEDLNGLPPS